MSATTQLLRSLMITFLAVFPAMHASAAEDKAASMPPWANPQARCPSKWGADDQRGTMNLMTPALVQKAARLVKTGKVYELGRELSARAGNSERSFSLVTLRSRGPAGLTARAGNEEQVVTNLGQIGTDLDGFAHVGIGESYYNCVQLKDIQTRTGFKKLGIETVGTIFTRGVLLDVTAAKGVTTLPPAYEITVQDLQDSLRKQNLKLEPGDAVLIYVGWEKLSDEDKKKYGAGQPGLSEAAGLWLLKQDPILIGSDNDAVEMFSVADAENPNKISLPVHQLALSVYGVHLLEDALLAELARDRAYEFLFVAQPLKLVGASGSTVVPAAIR